MYFLKNRSCITVALYDYEYSIVYILYAALSTIQLNIEIFKFITITFNYKYNYKD